MRLAPIWQWLSQFRRRGDRRLGLGAIALGLCVLLLSCSGNLQASGTVDTDFKEKVLQVIREHPDVILESVREYQQAQQQSREESREQLLQAMKSDRAQVIGQSPQKGAENGKTLLLEYSDFQCPFCAKAQETLNDLLTKFPDRVTLVYKHFPLTSIHNEALPAAKASWAAQQQGKFWEYHDALFAKQAQLGEELYVELAESLNLDMVRFNRDRASEAATQAIDADAQQAKQIGADGTPFFLMSGERFAGPVQLQDLQAFLAQANDG